MISLFGKKKIKMKWFICGLSEVCAWRDVPASSHSLPCDPVTLIHSFITAGLHYWPHTHKRSKSEGERQILYDITYMGNLKYDTNEPI